MFEMSLEVELNLDWLTNLRPQSISKTVWHGNIVQFLFVHFKPHTPNQSQLFGHPITTPDYSSWQLHLWHSRDVQCHFPCSPSFDSRYSHQDSPTWSVQMASFKKIPLCLLRQDILEFLSPYHRLDLEVVPRWTTPWFRPHTGPDHVSLASFKTLSIKVRRKGFWDIASHSFWTSLQIITADG